MSDGERDRAPMRAARTQRTVQRQSASRFRGRGSRMADGRVLRTMKEGNPPAQSRKMGCVCDETMQREPRSSARIEGDFGDPGAALNALNAMGEGRA